MLFVLSWGAGGGGACIFRPQEGKGRGGFCEEESLFALYLFNKIRANNYFQRSSVTHTVVSSDVCIPYHCGHHTMLLLAIDGFTGD